MEKLSLNQQIIMLKGLSSSLLQFTHPSIEEANKLLKDFGYEITSLITVKEKFEQYCETIKDEFKPIVETSTYQFRGLSSNGLNWYIGGEYSNPTFGNASGILEWCTSLADAQKMYQKMLQYDELSNLKKSSINLDNADYGEFCLDFYEAMFYLQNGENRKVQYETATNREYIKYIFFEQRFELWDYDGIIDRHWNRMKEMEDQALWDKLNTDMKWAIVG